MTARQLIARRRNIAKARSKNLPLRSGGWSEGIDEGGLVSTLEKGKGQKGRDSGARVINHV